MHINTIYMKNYRRFAEAKFSFPSRFTVIIGNNAAGKTTAMDALSFAIGCFVRGLDTGYHSTQNESPRSIYPEDVRWAPGYGTERKEQFPVIIEAEGKLFDQPNTWSGRQEGMDRQRNKVLLDKGEKKIEEAAKRAQVIARSEQESEQVILPLLAYFGPERLGTGLRLTKRKDEGKSKVEQVPYAKQGARLEGYIDCLSPKSSGKQFKSWFKTLEDRVSKFADPIDIQQVKLFSEKISEIIPAYRNIRYDFAKDEIAGFFEDAEGNVTNLPLSSLSNGFQNFIGILADLSYRCIKLNPHLKEKAAEVPGIVLIDEIDLHLHPTWQRRVVADLKRAFPNVQFIVTTHSPFVVQSLKAEELINLDSMPPVVADPDARSLEENALYMGVSSPRSEDFEEKTAFAEHYMNALSSGGLTPQIEQELNDHLEKFSDDPAFVAKLKIEKLFKTGKV